MRSSCRRALVLLSSLLAVPAAFGSAGPLRFVEDDYTEALAQARRRGLPIFLEAWAPWCHSCRSMKAYVYTDPKLAPYADRFVWLAIDTEKPGNAATVAKFPVGAWPSMYVIDPETETVRYRWTGSATVEQLTQFLDEAAPTKPAPAGVARDPLAVALERADKLNGAAAWEAAAEAYAAVLVHAPAGWASLPRVSDAYVFSLSRANRTAECAGAARAALPRLVGQPSSGFVAAVGLDCALGLEASIAWRGAAVAELEAAARQALADPKLGLAEDDRSGIYISLLSAREDAGDEAGKKKVLDEWIAQLETAAAKAPNPDARAVYDSHRLSAYLEAGEPLRAVPMLQASERDLPGDYNPPARLAVAYLEAKRFDDALAASDRALARAYGPRRLGILRTRSKIFAGLGRTTAAKATLQQAISESEMLPESQRSAGMLAALRRDLDALEKPKPATS